MTDTWSPLSFRECNTVMINGNYDYIIDNPDQPTVEHFQMLRRQWASRAHFLMATLQSLRNVQDSSVEGRKSLIE